MVRAHTRRLNPPPCPCAPPVRLAFNFQPDFIMHSIVRPSLLLLVAITGLNAAELPKKAPLSRYAPLWDSSPFTTKPKPPENAPLVNPFEDLALKGVAPIAGGYLITLINTKNPAEAVPPIDTDRPSKYKVLKIERDADNPLGTVVHLSQGEGPGAIVGTVSFNEKFSTPKTAAPKPGHKLPGQPQSPGQPPVAGQPPQPQIPGQPINPTGAASRQPRARVVPPPPTTGQPSGAQPTAQPLTRPTTTGSGTNTHGNQSHQRPSRR